MVRTFALASRLGTCPAARTVPCHRAMQDEGGGAAARSRDAEAHLFASRAAGLSSPASAGSPLRGTTVCVVTAGRSAGKRFVLDRAHELGVSVVVLDGPGSWTSALVAEGVVSELLEVDLHLGVADEERGRRGEAAALAALRALAARRPLHGLCTFSEHATARPAGACRGAEAAARRGGRGRRRPPGAACP